MIPIGNLQSFQSVTLNSNIFLLIIDMNLCYSEAMSDREPSGFLQLLPESIVCPAPAVSQPQKRKRRILRKPMFWWVVGGIFFMSGAIGASLLIPLYPSMLFLFGQVFQAIDCVRVIYALGAASWLVGVVIKVVKLYGDRPPVERPRPRDRVVTILRVLACCVATSLVVGFAAVIGVVSVFLSSTFQVLSPPGPDECHVIYEVSLDLTVPGPEIPSWTILRPCRHR